MIALLTCILAQHVDNDIVYSTVGKKELTLDAYRPATPNGRVFLVFHDGDFTNGVKGGQTAELCRYLSKRGFTCFDANYRLQRDIEGADINKAMSEAVNDGLAAYAWTQKNAAKFGGDPDRIAIGGMSAGAVIAMTAAYTKHVGARAVIDMWGGLFGKATDMKQGGPPLMIIHGLNDKQINISMARAIENRAISCQIPVQFVMHYGGHGIDLNKEVAKQSILELIDSFLRVHIR